MKRPRPPESLLEEFRSPFLPAPECVEWIRETFIAADGELYNEEHAHLDSATIGVLWTAVSNSRHMRSVVGQAEMPTFMGNAWSRGRQIQQMTEWFGSVPTFIITFDAAFALSCSDIDWCRLVEHELYHCGQAQDVYGSPKFRTDGTPAFAIRGHDIEEFGGVVRRYGAPEGLAKLMLEAKTPQVAHSQIDGACGTCRLNL